VKAYVTRHASDTLQACRECCGGQGYLAENRIAPIRADADVFTTFEGDNVVLLQLVAKALLTEWRQQFGSFRLSGVLRYLGRRASARLAQLNPVVTRNGDRLHLRDGDVELALLRYREERLLASAARRLKGRIDDGMDSFDAFTEVQDHLLHLATAHVERVVLEATVAAERSEADPALAAVRGRLRALFALAAVERDAGWFLESGAVEPPKSRAVRAEVNALCEELRPDAVALVDAFGIPDALLAAPIALDAAPAGAAG
jgi:acyl-CoA oxidase